MTRLKALWKTFRIITLISLVEILSKELLRSVKNLWERCRGGSTQQEKPRELGDSDANTVPRVEALPTAPAPARLA